VSIFLKSLINCEELTHRVLQKILVDLWQMRQKCSCRFENKDFSNSAVAESLRELVQYFSCKDRLVATPFNVIRLVVFTCRWVPDLKIIRATRVLVACSTSRHALPPPPPLLSNSKKLIQPSLILSLRDGLALFANLVALFLRFMVASDERFFGCFFI